MTIQVQWDDKEGLDRAVKAVHRDPLSTRFEQHMKILERRRERTDKFMAIYYSFCFTITAFLALYLLWDLL